MFVANIDKEIQEAGYPIWNNLYVIEMTQKDTYSEGEIRACGVFSTGDEQYDRYAMNGTLQRCITINDMTEYHHSMIPFKLMNNDNTVVILGIIRRYMSAWKNYKDVHGLDERIPVEDLLKLDKLAIALAANVINVVPTSPTPMLHRYGGLRTSVSTPRPPTSTANMYYSSYRAVFIPDTPLPTNQLARVKSKYPRPSWK